MAKTLSAQIADCLHTSADTIGMSKGDVLLRRGFFYAPSGGSEGFAEMVRSSLQGKVFAHKGQQVMVAVQDHGMVHRPFKGGASVAQQSHMWVRLAVIAL
jgi:hypothetical protein